MISSNGIGKNYSSFSSQTGQGWLVFPNLPAGDYTISFGQYGNVNYKVNGGKMPFTVETFAADKKVVIN